MSLFHPFGPAISSPTGSRKAAPLAVQTVRIRGDARYDRLKDWLRANETALAGKTLADDDRLSHHALAVYPAAKGGCLAVGTGCFAGGDPKAPVYVLGDTHGDIDSFVAILEAVLDSAEERGEGAPTLYLLGDVLDRNGEGCMLECALVLAILQKALPEEFTRFNGIRLGIVKGDHDIALCYREPYDPASRFTALVKPADYCDWLNERLDAGGGEDATKIGRAWIRLMEECPAAVFLEEQGTLLAHGGVPREDLQKRFAAGEPYLLQSGAFAQDFEWCRMVDAKKKLLNRGSKTSEIGGLEFDSFCKTVFPSPDGGGTRVRRFVFAHQHPAKGFEQYSRFYDGYEAVCIASFRDEEVFGGPSMPHFCRLGESDGTGFAPAEAFCVDLSFEADAPQVPLPLPEEDLPAAPQEESVAPETLRPLGDSSEAPRTADTPPAAAQTESAPAVLPPTAGAPAAAPNPGDDRSGLPQPEVAPSDAPQPEDDSFERPWSGNGSADILRMDDEPPGAAPECHLSPLDCALPDTGLPDVSLPPLHPLPSFSSQEEYKSKGTDSPASGAE